MGIEKSPLQREVEEVASLRSWVRAELYSVREGAGRANASTAVASAAAEETFRLGAELPDWWNDTSVVWRGHLGSVWAHLEGDSSQHYVLSQAVANFLTSPLNHNEGDAGPDDFDRPWTVAAYSAVVSALMWGVDFAVTAVGQIFECVDLRYGDEFPNDRVADVARLIKWVRDTVGVVTAAVDSGPSNLDSVVIGRIRQPPS